MAVSRLIACLGALWVVFGASIAGATTRVPMCGEHAQTVIAPPISRPISDATLRPGYCEDRSVHGFTTGLPERPKEPAAAPELVPRMPPIFHRLAPVPRSRVSIETAESGERTGHRNAIERPPR